MFWDIDGRQTDMKMLECRMAMSSKEVMQQLEMTVDRVVSRNGGTSSWYDDADRSRQRLGRSATRASWFRYGGARPCSTRAETKFIFAVFLSQSIAEIQMLPLIELDKNIFSSMLPLLKNENKRLPCWNSTSGFDFGHIIVSSVWIYISNSNISQLRESQNSNRTTHPELWCWIFQAGGNHITNLLPVPGLVTSYIYEDPDTDPDDAVTISCRHRLIRNSQLVSTSCVNCNVTVRSTGCVKK